MKNINLKFISIACLFLITSIKSYSQISKAEIIATGLTCSMCSNAINKQLKATVGVDSVSTDLNTNTFTVYFKKESKIMPRVLKEGVEKAGFFIGSLVITVPTENLKIEGDKTISLNGSTFVLLNEELKNSNGETKLKVYDKGYVTQKEHKKLLKTFSKTASYPLDNEDDYHIKTVI
ncbi:heavy-metal-associated domain-containing protein [Flavobacterium algoritolerans]|uniref:Heavy-metal-associated domain-containing protein n=1 Tax=Flavobacterium algoritolerans TaxID=3041254 RepID=A0ABT6V611_9FLAO|nr:heavy-metal-associated domain-containing protein [Flavobacterium algoritolerans]MDI5893668.1 heavy-metal-associated domain-containing protein [Flavobacterium algoritolerans]